MRRRLFELFGKENSQHYLSQYVTEINLLAKEFELSSKNFEHHLIYIKGAEIQVPTDGNTWYFNFKLHQIIVPETCINIISHEILHLL